jgi:hypothetical protein
MSTSSPTDAVACPRCGAAPGETCAYALLTAALKKGDMPTAHDLERVNRAGPSLAHPERMEEALALVALARRFGITQVQRLAPAGS